MNIKLLSTLSLLGFASLCQTNLHAEYVLSNDPFDFWSSDGWEVITDADGATTPGSGGQAFDTEYLYYKYNESTNEISVGLQTGFDIIDGRLDYNNHAYYAGDLALSFDGVGANDTNSSNNSTNSDAYSATYEYAIDFGLQTKTYNYGIIEASGADDYNNDGDLNDSMTINYSQTSDRTFSEGDNNDGVDQAGLYAVSEWNNDIYYTSSSPFAMDEGTLLQSIAFTNTGLSNGDISSNPGTNSYGGGFSDGTNNSGTDASYFRVVTFSLDNIVDLASNFTVDAHWTMSCGNDFINGNESYAASNPSNPVPEPSILALFSMGFLSMGLIAYRRRKYKFTA